MKTQFLVLGATGGLGYAVTKALLDQQIETTVLVRDANKANRLFGIDPHLKVITGDANDPALLKLIAADKTHIFHGLNTPYEKWTKDMPWLTQYVIEAAEAAGARVIFPGNNYNYGTIGQPITEITPFQPNTDLGRARVDLENRLKEAVRLERIKALVVRLPEVWGPNVCNRSFEPLFQAVLKGKSIPWLYNIDVAQQMIFNMDAGKAIVAMALSKPNRDYESVNVGGILHSSMRGFFQQVADQNETLLRTTVLSGKAIRVLSPFNKNLKAVSTLEYKYQKTIMLDDTSFKLHLPDFEYTPTDEAISQTLTWFRTYRLVPEAGRKQQKRKAVLIDFLADNLSIGIFPLLIGLLTANIPGLQSMAVIFGVVAGIYWSPFMRMIFRKLAPQRKTATAALLLMLGLGLQMNAHAQSAPFNGFYGTVETGRQNVFSGALIDGVDVLSNEQEMITSLGLGYRKTFFQKRIMLGTELQLGLLNTDRQRSYHNGQQLLNIDYSGDSQWSMGFQFGTITGTKKQTVIYLFAYDTNRNFDIEFSEENGTVHRQRDENAFTRYGLGVETRLYKQLYLNSKVGGISVKFDNDNRSESLNQKMEMSLGLSYHF